jgi:hypothetical protein
MLFLSMRGPVHLFSKKCRQHLFHMPCCVRPLLIAEDPANNIVVAEGTVNAAASALDWFWQRIGLTFSTGDWLAAIAQADRDPDSVPYFINRSERATGSPDWLPAAGTCLLETVIHRT